MTCLKNESGIRKVRSTRFVFASSVFLLRSELKTGFLGSRSIGQKRPEKKK
jgi:hypothetical protein